MTATAQPPLNRDSLILTDLSPKMTERKEDAIVSSENNSTESNHNKMKPVEAALSVTGEETETTPSDSDNSCCLYESDRRRSSSSTLTGSHHGILRVTTLEESLSQHDIAHRSSCSIREHAPLTIKEDKATTSDKEEEDTSSAAEDDRSSCKNQRSVSFTSVELREYAVCLGDNPAVLEGAPLTIEWEAQSQDSLSVDDYENHRPERRRNEQLKIPPFARDEMLRQSGYSRGEIQKGTREVNIARARRKRTNDAHRLDKAQELAERLVRGTLNMTVKRQQKKQERDLIEHFRTSAQKTLEEKKHQARAERRATWCHSTTLAPKVISPPTTTNNNLQDDSIKSTKTTASTTDDQPDDSAMALMNKSASF